MSEELKDVDLTKAPEPTEAKEPEKKEEKQEEPQDAAQALSAMAGAPTQLQLEEWKQQFGEVCVSGFSQTELFIFRPLSRGEFTNLQAHLAQSEGVSQLEVEEKICDACVLWASEPALASLKNKAGTLTTLHEQIMQQSNFVDPRFAGTFVVRL
jgi:hypothetical protein